MTEIGRNEPAYTVRVPGHEDLTFTLGWAAVTDTGRRRRQNEDSLLARSPIFAVADGMGGHAAGDRASAAVVTRLAERISGDFVTPSGIEEGLRSAAADIALAAADTENGSGTTATGVALTLVGFDPYWVVFNVGDSRVYQWRSGALEQITVDHSVVQELVDAGTITREQAEHHPHSNMITRAIGFNEIPAPDYWMLPIAPGSRMLVCSDGLNRELDDEAIRRQLGSGDDAITTARALVDSALAGGGRDNITVIVVDVL